MPNIGQIIATHNRKILEAKQNDKEKTCCRNMDNCPLKEVKKSCATENVVYKAFVKTKADIKTYIGLTSNSFKTRWYGHQESFKKEKYRTRTALSNYIWELKQQNKTYEIKWDIIKKVKNANVAVHVVDCVLQRRQK